MKSCFNMCMGVAIAALGSMQTASATELIPNGGFETGDFTGWTRIDAGSGTFVINDGTLVPGSGDGPLAPCQGNFSAVTDQSNPGLHTLYQDVTIPALAATATLHWIDMIRNHNGAFSDPNQEFRVEIWDPNTNAVLASLFSTNPGDLALQNCTARSADISAFIGQTVRIAFTEEDSLSFFNLHVDDVRIEITDAQIFASDPQGANLGTVDPLTGLFTVIGPFTGGGATLHPVDPTTGTILTSVVHDFGALNGLEFDAAGNLLGTLIGGPGTPSELVMVNTNPGILTVIGLTGFNAIGGLAFDAGFTTLFGITSGGAAIPPTLLTVNPATGAAAAIPVVSVAVEMSSLEFTSSGQLVAGGADGIFYEIDTVTGVATAVGPLVNAGKVSGLSVKPGGVIPPGVPKPDGWFISFHEPLVEGLPPQSQLGLYFCDEADVQISTTGLPACDGHDVLEYVVDLASCCLVHANVDSRTGSIPAQFDGFFEEQCLSYATDIQAVVGHKFVEDGFGACIEESTGELWDEDVWGWHSTTTEIGAAFGLGPALQTVVTMDGKDWLYGPWGPVDITCGQRNMAFELITDTPNEEDPDADGDGVIDKDLDGDGVREPFQINFLAARSNLHERYQRYVQAQFKQAGIQVNLDQLEWSVFEQRLLSRDFEMIVMAWTGNPETDAFAMWHSSQVIDQGSNIVGFVNDEADRLIEQARQTMEYEPRMELWRQFHRLLHVEQPYTFLFTGPRLTFIDQRFKNVQRRSLRLYTSEWYVPADLQRR